MGGQLFLATLWTRKQSIAVILISTKYRSTCCVVLVIYCSKHRYGISKSFKNRSRYILVKSLAIEQKEQSVSLIKWHFFASDEVRYLMLDVFYKSTILEILDKVFSKSAKGVHINIHLMFTILVIKLYYDFWERMQ